MNKRYFFTFFALLSLLSQVIIAMEGPAFKTDFTVKSKDSVKINSQEGTEFTVDLKLAESSETLKNLIEDVGQDHPIPLPTISGITLSRILTLAQDKTLETTLTLSDIIALLEAQNYLDMAKEWKPLLKAIANKLSWNIDDLVAFFNNPTIPQDYKALVLPKMVKKLPWSIDAITDFYKSRRLSRAFKLHLLQELIKANEVQLQLVVTFWNLHLKKCRERGIEDPMSCGMRIIKPTQEDKNLHKWLIGLLGNDYDELKRRLLGEYPGE